MKVICFWCGLTPAYVYGPPLRHECGCTRAAAREHAKRTPEEGDLYLHKRRGAVVRVLWVGETWPNVGLRREGPRRRVNDGPREWTAAWATLAKKYVRVKESAA